MDPRPYVERDGDLVFPPPYAATGVKLTTFLLHADRDTLQRQICDRYLNKAADAPGRFQAVGAFVMLVWAQMDRLSAVNAPYAHMGSTPEQEAAFWVLVADRARRGSLGWFHPYMWVDNGYALILGREVYGFPKALGKLVFPRNAFNPTTFRAETLVHTGSTGPLTMKAVVEVRRSRRAGGTTPVPDHAGLVAHVAREVESLFDRGLMHVANSVLLQGAPMLFLKQLRDAEQAGAACYQAILEAHSSMGTFRAGTVLPNDYTIDVHSYPSHPIQSDLALQGGTKVGARVTRVKPMIGFVTDFDFEIGPGVPVVTAVGTPVGAQHGLSVQLQPLQNGSRSGRPRKIAILGGGVGAMSAALELTGQPGWQSRYEITVYQMGWRLGGKGASGRGEDDRIEEHGLHIWFGFYRSAFDMMARVYRELGRTTGPIRTVGQAFRPQTDLGVMEMVGKEWKPWRFPFPEAHGRSHARIAEYIERVLHWLGYQMLLFDGIADPNAVARDGLLSELARSEAAFGVTPTQPALMAYPHHLATKAAHVVREIIDAVIDADAGWDRVVAHLEQGIDHFVAARAEGDTLRRAMILWHLVRACVNGLRARNDRLLGPLNLSDLDDVDLRAWLKANGAPREAYESALIKGIYDLVFGYIGGDVTRPSLSAGVALQGVLRMAFDYDGAVAFKMEAGMGDVVFAPLYEVLQRRGVKFKFFQRVQKLGLSRDGQSIDTIDIVEQATPRGGQQYQPLHTVKGVPSWPAQPDVRQLREGQALQAHDLESDWTGWQRRTPPRVLRAGEDFDDVILGIPVGALPDIAGELARAHPAWQAMFDNVKTVRTIAMQLWLTRTAAELGWRGGAAVVDGFADPFNTWADMSHLIRREDHPPQSIPHSLAYFCGPLADDPQASPHAAGYAEAQRADAAMRAAAWLDNNIRFLWPDAVDQSGRFRYDLLADPQNRSGAARMAAQYVRVNIDGSERYTTSHPGSAKYRLLPAGSGFRNLYLAGDWTRSTINGGCVEGAVESGQAAARGLLQEHGWLERPSLAASGMHYALEFMHIGRELAQLALSPRHAVTFLGRARRIMRDAIPALSQTPPVGPNDQ